jgi:hypothetical protein
MPEETSQSDTGDDEGVPCVAACETRPGRTVFTEDSSEDAWIATDLTVTVRR